jgi:hypothetical protein
VGGWREGGIGFQRDAGEKEKKKVSKKEDFTQAEEEEGERKKGEKKEVST